MTEIIKNKIRVILSKSNLAKNLARQKLIVEIIWALIKCKNVQIQELSLHINTRALVSSSTRRIQAFFQNFAFEDQALAQGIASLLPHEKVNLCIDRTEWDFGKFQCNILMITAYFHGVGFPLFWELLDNKSGNSATIDRIDLVEKCVHLLGKARIACVIGDREFVGKKWLNYLKTNQIPFCMRLPKHHLLVLKNGQTYSIEELLNRQEFRFFQHVLVEGVVCNISIKKLKNNEYLFLAGSDYSKKLGDIYRKRWSIEVCFQSFKTRGFNLEMTHLRSHKKLKTLLVFVSISLALCVKLGFLLHEKKKNIKTKNHGYKANSFFRVGLDTFRKLSQNREKELFKFVMDFLQTWEHLIVKNKLYLFDNQFLIKK